MAVNLEERIDTLEAVFGRFMAQTGAAMLRLERTQEQLAREMLEFKNEMLDFKNEMADFKNEMADFKNEMADFKNEMGDFKNEMREYKNKLDKTIEEMRRAQEESRREWNKKWGDLARKMGTMVEDLVHPSLERIIKEQFDLEVEDLMIRRKRKRKDGSRREFDAIAVAGEFVFLTSVKSELTHKRDVDDFVKEISEFREYYPEYKEYKLIGILATLHCEAGVLNYAEKKGFLVLAVGDEIMDVQNHEGFKPKYW